MIRRRAQQRWETTLGGCGHNSQENSGGLARGVVVEFREAVEL
jgi:hypothetical protein